MCKVTKSGADGQVYAEIYRVYDVLVYMSLRTSEARVRPKAATAGAKVPLTAALRADHVSPCSAGIFSHDRIVG